MPQRARLRRTAQVTIDPETARVERHSTYWDLQQEDEWSFLERNVVAATGKIDGVDAQLVQVGTRNAEGKVRTIAQTPGARRYDAQQMKIKGGHLGEDAEPDGDLQGRWVRREEFIATTLGYKESKRPLWGVYRLR